MLFVRIAVAFVLTIVLAIVIVGAGFLVSISPKEVPGVVDVEIARGATLQEAALALKEAGVVRSAFAFQSFVLLHEGESKIIAGEYRFSDKASARAVAERLLLGEFNNESQGVTFPEGSTVSEMGAILEREIPGFDHDLFLEQASPYEGYLFPDTYFFHNDVTVEEVIERMRNTFKEKTADLSVAASLEGQSLADIITMASILEEEATNMDARSIVSGILWARLEEGMPLQVDAAFLYIDELSDKNTYSLTQEDLKIESPYNTYVNAGLPPTPITNPGLESIQAAANPVQSEYTFYLSDTKGNMYYAETFEEHKANRQFLSY